jgi:hypothetical protein
MIGKINSIPSHSKMTLDEMIRFNKKLKTNHLALRSKPARKRCTAEIEATYG